MESNDELEKLVKEEKQNRTSLNDFMEAIREIVSVYGEVVNILKAMQEQENEKKSSDD